MDLDRGMLAKIDRRMFSGLDHDENFLMVRVPVSEAMWSTWRRYCAAMGVSMGRGIAGLIAHELATVVGQQSDGGPVFAPKFRQQLVMQSEELNARERRLDERERSLRASERRLRARAIPLESSAGVKVGRNDPCPCGSGFKYKRCHGSSSARPITRAADRD